MTAKSTSAVAYVRTSREFKNVERISEAQQIEDAKKRAEQEGLTLSDDHIYSDKDVSSRLYPQQLAPKGARKFRPALTRLLSAVERGEVGTIICRKLDRISRLLDLSISIRKYLAARQVRVIATHETLPTDPNDPSGVFTLNVLAAAAEHQLESIRSNIKAGKRYSKDHGLKLGGVRLLGYRNAGRGKVKKDEGEARLVREIFNRYLDGATLVGLANWLNTEHADKSKLWRYSQVRDKLTNPLYIGKVKNTEGILIDSAVYRQIVSPSVFHRVQKRIENRKNTRSTGNTITHLFSGILVCGVCGQRLTPMVERQRHRKMRKWFAFKCRNKHKNRPFGMDEAEWSRWADVVFSHARLASTLTAEDAEERASLEIQLAGLDTALEEGRELVADRRMTMSEFAKVAERIERNKTILAGQINAIVNKASTKAETTLHAWKTLSTDEKREYIKTITETIVVGRDEVTVSLREGCHIILSDDSLIRFPLLQLRSHGHWKNALLPPIKNHLRFEVDNGTVHWLDTDEIRLGHSVPSDSKQCPRCGKVLKRLEYGNASYCKPCIKTWRSGRRRR